MPESFPISFGRYRLVERLAIGGMAEVFLAEVGGEHGFEKRVVIKRLLPHLQREPGYTAMFIDEAKLTARLVHPKIAQTHELGRVEDQLFIAMEFVDGVDVLAMLREYAHRRERLPVDLAVWIAHEVLDALDYAHKLTDPDGRPLGVVHRDISPSNVLLSKRGDVKLVDFGIARASEPGRHHRTKSGTLKGKYGYMSPEQVLEQQVDARSDLFSIGIVLAEMLCGRRLFAAPNELDVLLMVRDAKLHRLDQYGGDIEKELDGILRKALKKDVDERWSSAGELRDALGDWLFHNRLRVSPKRVADAVQGIYDAAWSRRRGVTTAEVAALAETPPPVEVAPVAVPAVAGAHARAPTTADTPRAIRSPAIVEVAEPGEGRRPPHIRFSTPGGNSDSDGIPRGLGNQTDSLPVITIEDADAALGALGLDDVAPEAPPLVETREPAPPVAPAPVVRIPPVGTPIARTGNTTPPPVSASQSNPAIKLPPRTVVTIPPLEEPPAPAKIRTTTSELSAAANQVARASSPPRVHERPPSEGLDLGDLDLFLGDPEALELGAAGGSKATPIVMPGGDPSSRYPSIESALEAFAQKEKDPDPSTIEFDDSRIEDEDRRRPTSEMPAITEADLDRAATKPPPELPSIEDTPAEAGDFGDMPPIKMLYRLLSQRQTGLLVTTVGAIKKEIFVRDGIPEYVSSNVSSELLGNWLVSQGVLSSGELAMALAMMPHYGGKLGDTVVGLGLLKPLEVFRHLTRQVRSKLIDVCTWTKGRYAWYSDRTNPREAFPLDLNAFEVLGAGAMALEDDAVGTWVDRNRDVHFKATKSGKLGPDRFELAGLRPIWDALDGRASVDKVLQKYDDAADRKKTARMLILLDYTELARRVEVTGR